MNASSPESINAIVLLATYDDRSLLRFPDNCQCQFPGLFLTGVRPDDPESWVPRIGQAIGQPELSQYINVEHQLKTPIEIDNGGKAYIFVAQIPAQYFTAPKAWKTLPDILRSLPKTKVRVTYMQVLQVLSGGLDDTVEAVEMDEELRDRLAAKLRDEKETP